MPKIHANYICALSDPNCKLQYKLLVTIFQRFPTHLYALEVKTAYVPKQIQVIFIKMSVSFSLSKALLLENEKPSGEVYSSIMIANLKKTGTTIIAQVVHLRHEKMLKHQIEGVNHRFSRNI